MMKKLELTGNVYGKTKVLGPAPKRSNDKGGQYWFCECECGKKWEARGSHLKPGRIRSCGCSRFYTKEKHPGWMGHEDMSGTFLLQLQTSAAKRNLPVTVSKEELWELFLAQNRKCALTGINLTFDEAQAKRNGNASIDRINPKEGYHKNNIQWVDKIVNRVKWILTDQQFIDLCRKVVQTKGKTD